MTELQNLVKLRISENGKSPVAYLSLPNHPKQSVAGCVHRTIRLQDLWTYSREPDKKQLDGRKINKTLSTCGGCWNLSTIECHDSVETSVVFVIKQLGPQRREPDIR